MNRSNQKYLAAFIAQRIEMGESEWNVNLRPTFEKNLKKSVTPTYADHNLISQQTASSVVSGDVQSACSRSMFSDTLISGIDSLKELYGAVCGCKRCQLGSLRKNFVFGEGNPDADIMFIGEAPGAEEDAQGLPFVGRAGGLLTQMIEAIKLHREDIFIANILKCRPPGNRDPKPEEIEMCEPILKRQIEIIKPQVICALGRISGQTLLRTGDTLGSLRGRVHNYHGVKLIVTYHPAALLRNYKWKRPAWEDLKFLRREYDGMEL